ncbi:unnamed protein product [Prorocentrum cordatum]|uniref:Non-specific serine/threonine protein kinase n=1 Tax=Prorocentrum cordatum TaxID=2364126 RepID=A0ABN9V9L0_9DINO|nr:unnamed protein product [Polarella glacialis]
MDGCVFFPQETFTFEYDVGLWTFGSVQVIKERASGALRFCKSVPRVALRGQPGEAVARLRKLQGLRQRHICPVVEVLEDASNILIISEKTAGGDVGEWTARVMEEGNWLQEPGQPPAFSGPRRIEAEVDWAGCGPRWRGGKECEAEV